MEPETVPTFEGVVIVGLMVCYGPCGPLGPITFEYFKLNILSLMPSKKKKKSNPTGRNLPVMDLIQFGVWLINHL